MAELRRVGEDLEAVLKDMGVAAPPDITRVVEQWPTLAGDPWAAHATPVGLRGDELIVEVGDGATATLLRYQVRLLLDRLEERLGGKLIGSVRIRLKKAKSGL